MLKNDAIHNLLFRFRNIDLNNINDIYFAINIIVIISITLLKALIAVIFIFKPIIIIVINVDIAIVIIVAFKRLIFKFIVFDFNINRRLAMSASFNKF